MEKLMESEYSLVNSHYLRRKVRIHRLRLNIANVALYALNKAVNAQRLSKPDNILRGQRVTKMQKLFICGRRLNKRSIAQFGCVF